MSQVALVRNAFCLLLALAILVLSRLFNIDKDYIFRRNSSTNFNYGVIVDCGSSGTRAHLFRWKRDQPISYIELIQDPSKGIPLSRHITPGLSSFRYEPDKASDYMEPIMEFVSESIPSDKHLDTPIYFLATAGLRLLDASIQSKILMDIERDLIAKFNFPKIKSQVISGVTEGVYSWLSLNMNKKLYTTASEDSKSKYQNSYGMIEMGGASTQVAFELSPEVELAILKDLKEADAIDAFKSEQTILNLGPNSSVKLFAATFLGLGVHSAREAAIDLLLRDKYLEETRESESDHSKHEVYLKDPCFTKGSGETVIRPVSLLHNPHHSIGSVIKQGEKTFKVNLEGTGDFQSCINLLTRVLQTVKIEKLNCSPSGTDKTCPMSLLATNFIPYHFYPFVGLSEMFFTTNEMMNLAGTFNRSRIVDETRRICTSHYIRLLEMYELNGIVSQEDRVLYECFKASWLLTILDESGFKMPIDYSDFTTLNRMDDADIDWTIGAMVSRVILNEASSNIF